MAAQRYQQCWLACVCCSHMCVTPSSVLGMPATSGVTSVTLCARTISVLLVIAAVQPAILHAHPA